MENQTGNKIKILRTDRGTEYEYKVLKATSEEFEITTLPYTPEQNGVSERLNRTLVVGGEISMYA